MALVNLARGLTEAECPRCHRHHRAGSMALQRCAERLRCTEADGYSRSDIVAYDTHTRTFVTRESRSYRADMADAHRSGTVQLTVDACEVQPGDVVNAPLNSDRAPEVGDYVRPCPGSATARKVAHVLDASGTVEAVTGETFAPGRYEVLSRARTSYAVEVRSVDTVGTSTCLHLADGNVWATLYDYRVRVTRRYRPVNPAPQWSRLNWATAGRTVWDCRGDMCIAHGLTYTEAVGRCGPEGFWPSVTPPHITYA